MMNIAVIFAIFCRPDALTTYREKVIIILDSDILKAVSHTY